MIRRTTASQPPSILTIGIYALVGGLLVLGQLIPGTTHQVAGGEILPQTLLWLLAAALLATERLLTSLSSPQWLALGGIRDKSIHSSSSEPQSHLPRFGLWPLLMASGTGIWLVLSTWHVAGRGNMRFAVNTAWYAVGALAALWVLGTIMRSALVTRMVFAILLSLAWLSAMSGYYQLGVSLPADREVFRKNPTELLRRNGIEAAPGTATYLQFERRLQDNVPLGPFSLTNSLAGFLASWIVFLLALGWRRDIWRSAPWRVALGILVFACLGGCVILTKSRSAWLAIAIGFCVVWLGQVVTDPASRRWIRRAFQGRRLVTSVFFLGAFLFSFFLLISAWDDKIWSEAWKSLAFRADYWRATLSMIQAHPWYGIGLGNFQGYYAAYKPPLASETVVDPHNFLLEVAATLGLPGLLLLILALAWLSRAWIASLVQKSYPDPSDAIGDLRNAQKTDRLITSNQSRAAIKATSAIYLGAFTGAMALWLGGGALGIPPDPFPFCLGFPFVATFLTIDFVLTLRSPAKLIDTHAITLALGAAFIAWCVHLCASSGWMSPGMMNSALVLIAGYVGVSWRQNAQKSLVSESAAVGKGGSALSYLAATTLSWGLLVGFYFTAWAPRQNSMIIEAEAMKIGLNEPRALAMQSADRWNPLGATWLAEVRVTEAENSLASTGTLNPIVIERIEASFQALIQSDHANPIAWAQVGHWSLRLAPYRRESLQRACEAYREAVHRDPHDTSLLLQLALTSWLLEDNTSVRDCLRRVAWNEENVPHDDCKLGAASIFWPAPLGPSSQRIPPSAWQSARQTDQLPRGWVRATPVFAFLQSQLTTESTVIR